MATRETARDTTVTWINSPGADTEIQVKIKPTRAEGLCHSISGNANERRFISVMLPYSVKAFSKLWGNTFLSAVHLHFIHLLLTCKGELLLLFCIFGQNDILGAFDWGVAQYEARFDICPNAPQACGGNNSSDKLRSSLIFTHISPLSTEHLQ